MPNVPVPTPATPIPGDAELLGFWRGFGLCGEAYLVATRFPAQPPLTCHSCRSSHEPPNDQAPHGERERDSDKTAGLDGVAHDWRASTHSTRSSSESLSTAARYSAPSRA